MRWAIAGLLTVMLLATGCVSRPAPSPATLDTGPAPWPAPRDAVSYIEAAGLPELPLNTDGDPFIVDLVVEVDGQPIGVPAFIGVDRLRALQAPVHTHDDSGAVWLEGEGNRDVTLGQFFTLWGVRFTDGCVGAACTGLEVTADGAPVADPADLVLRGVAEVRVAVRSG